MSTHGGKRARAGRKKGSKTLDLLEMLEKKGRKDKTDYIAEFLDFLIDNYKEDSRLMIWMGDHIYGKPAQAITGPDGGAIKIESVEISVRK